LVNIQIHILSSAHEVTYTGWEELRLTWMWSEGQKVRVMFKLVYILNQCGLLRGQCLGIFGANQSLF